MKRNKYNAILKGSLALAAVLLMEGGAVAGQIPQMVNAAETQETAGTEENSGTGLCRQ